jgi:hypothetical protein
LPIDLLVSVRLIDDNERGNNVTEFLSGKVVVFFISILIKRYVPIPTARIFTTRSNALKCGGVTGMPW